MLIALTVGGVAASVPSALGARDPVLSSRDLWATVNICDTRNNPDTIGVRASMPAGRRREAMFVRFQVQYFAPADKRWHSIERGGDSGRRFIGSGRNVVRQAGNNFAYVPPIAGQYVVRGKVSFEWRRGGKVVRRAREYTRKGHRNARGADPRGYSASLCEIKS